MGRGWGIGVDHGGFPDKGLPPKGWRPPEDPRPNLIKWLTKRIRAWYTRWKLGLDKPANDN